MNTLLGFEGPEAGEIRYFGANGRSALDPGGRDAG